MVDRLTKEHRSWVMGRIRSRNTKPEIMVRSILHRLGYRFRINRHDLPGKPDIVLPKYKTVVFVHGCFWHRHKNCSRATMPKTRPQFWQEKFDRNVARDKRSARKLRSDGWHVLTVWECEIQQNPLKVARRLDHKMRGENNMEYQLPTRHQLLRAAEKKADYNVD